MLKIKLKKTFKHEKMSFRFELKSNRIVLFGPSGCGKTTLIKMIAGFLKPDSGNIEIGSTCYFSTEQKINIPVYKRLFGYLPQENTLFPNMTVKDNILYGIKARKLSLNKSEFDNIVHRLRIDHKLNSMPATLSGGQIQRAALARILLIRPKLLLLDEPFNALDTPVKECLRELITELADELDISIIFVTHDVEDAFTVGKEIAILDDGKVIEYGEMDDVYNSPKYIETAKLLDYKNIFLSSEFNAIESLGFIEKIHEEEFICIRPDNIKLYRYNNNSKVENSIEGVIGEVHIRGRYVKVLFRCKKKYLLHIQLSKYEFAKQNLIKGDKAVIKLNKNSVNFCKAFK